MTDTPSAGDRPDGMAALTRDGHGQFARSVSTAERDAEAARLRSRSLTYRQIGERLGITPQSAHEAVQRALRVVLAEAAEDVRALELEKLDALERAALDVATRDRTIVSAGRVTDIPDDAPRLQALATLLRIGESRRKLLGLDSPAKVTVDGGVRYVLEGVDPAALT